MSPDHELAMAIARACNIPDEMMTELSIDFTVDRVPHLRTVHLVTSPKPISEIHQTWQPTGRGRTFTLFGRRVAIWKVIP